MTTLVLAAHGSADPRSASNARAVANQIRFMRPGLRVRVAFCDLNTPRLEDVVTPGAVVAPFLLADAYHARVDIPGQLASCDVGLRQADVLGEDDRLIAVMHERLAELGVSTSDPELGVLVVAIGSTHAAANARTSQVANKLIAGTQWACATTAFATGTGPSPAEGANSVAPPRRPPRGHCAVVPGSRSTDRSGREICVSRRYSDGSAARRASAGSRNGIGSLRCGGS